MAALPEQSLRAWVQYLRDMGIYDLYRRETSPTMTLSPELLTELASRRSTEASSPKKSSGGPPVPRAAAASAAARPRSTPDAPTQARAEDRRPSISPAAPQRPAPAAQPAAGRSYFPPETEASPRLPPELAAPMPKPNPLEALFPPPPTPHPAAEKGAALERLRAEIGDCTRCPLAYAGRHTIVFGEGDPDAQLMFVGEGPGADEDESGRPFVGKAGQLLNNMIVAMGLQREQVYIANIVKCRPPKNRAPEFDEATTCSRFLLEQIDIVQPRILVALGSTAATYLLGVRQTLASLRGQWFAARGAKVVVTFHPAYLLRDPRQKAEAWKDLQLVMAELGLKATPRRT